MSVKGKGKVEICLPRKKKIRIKRGNMRNTLWKLYYLNKRGVA